MVILHTKPFYKNLFFVFISAFSLRALIFSGYIINDTRYRQADSNDYHVSAISIIKGAGMSRIPSGQPIFWRTPGYPWYLSLFYRLCGVQNNSFNDNHTAQKLALWMQIFLCSFIPIIIFFLALTLTHALSIAWISAWICVLHIGFILSSTFLLTEGLALLFFYLFLIFFFKSFYVLSEKPIDDRDWKKNLMYAGLFLGITTWLRPMGEFVSILCSLLILLCAHDTLFNRLKKIGLFLCIFYICLVPWYIRNYRLTDSFFFCPMFGTYLNSFVAPKIVRDLEKQPLEIAWTQLQEQAYKKAIHDHPIKRLQGKYVVPEHTALFVALPIIKAHPFIALKVWMPEVIKTAFDLHSYQLIALANDTYKSDPLEEFLSAKISGALYKEFAPRWIRIICWIDFIFTLWLWVSLILGMCIFWLIPSFKKWAVSQDIKEMASFWFKMAFITGGIIFMTGGYGYARLRLPVEPLMIITALTLWIPSIKYYVKKA